MEKYAKSSSKAANVLANKINKDGVLDIATSGDLAAQYKLPTLLLMSGYTIEANRLLDRIKRDFMQSDGDFLSYPRKEGQARKSTSFAMSHFWTYMNGWIVMAAQRLGRFDISVPGFDFCKRFYDPDLKACSVEKECEAGREDRTLDTLMTAHFGLTCLYMGGNKG